MSSAELASNRRGAGLGWRRLRWQERAFELYDQLGEIKYAAQFYARMLSGLRLYPAELGERGQIVETDQPEVRAQVERIQDPGGGRANLLASYGQLMFIAGECYLLVTIDADIGREQWEVVSTAELRVQDGLIYRVRSHGQQQPQVWRESRGGDWGDPGVAMVYRLWRRHPRYSDEPDSTLRGVLDLAEELLLLSQAVRSRASSRLAGNGLLLLPQEISPSPAHVMDSADAQQDPFLRQLVEHLTAPLSKPGSTSAVVPIVVRGPAEYLDKIRHLQVVDPTQLYPETGLRQELIRRIALGLDMPPEVLLGTADLNHWSAWLVDEQAWRSHGQPIARQLCQDLTQAFLRPALRELGIPDWDRYLVWFDATDIVVHPDRSRDAKDLYDRRAVGKRALRDAAGFTDDDAPSPDELAEMLAVALRDGSMVADGSPSPPAASAPADVQPGPPPAGPPRSREADEETAARIAGAAQLALLRAREVAGSRLRNLLRRQPQVAAEVDGLPAREVPARLGRERVLALTGRNERELVDGAGELMADALRLWGLDEALIPLLVERVEEHAARTLYDPHPPPLPPSVAAYVQAVSRKP
ncbi:MAG: hypothetical protein QN122_12125 [Armatimonadota bacterium]|nr:hypothetical protein [Armatimonadota bacterium]